MDMGQVLFCVLNRLCHLKAVVMGKIRRTVQVVFADSSLQAADNLHHLEKRHASKAEAPSQSKTRMVNPLIDQVSCPKPKDHPLRERIHDDYGTARLRDVDPTTILPRAEEATTSASS